MEIDNGETLPIVNVVIPVHNRIGHTVKCLTSLRKVNYPGIKIIVVDNGSTDGTERIISTQYSEVKLLKSNGNLWWTGAVNLGIKSALSQDNETDYIILLNNDNIVAPNFLKPLVLYHQQRPRSIPGAIVLCVNSPDKIRSVGGTIDWRRGVLSIGYYGYSYDHICKEPTKVDTLGGQGVLIHRDVFARIGLFDERLFPHYAADTDFFLRAEGFGFENIVIPESKVWDDLDSTGTRKIGKKINIVPYICSLFSIKSSNNILTMYRLFKRHCSFKPFYIPLAAMYLREIKNLLFY
jgi:GT2 family glycosyltransferase